MLTRYPLVIVRALKITTLKVLSQSKATDPCRPVKDEPYATVSTLHHVCFSCTFDQGFAEVRHRASEDSPSDAAVGEEGVVSPRGAGPEPHRVSDRQRNRGSDRSDADAFSLPPQVQCTSLLARLSYFLVPPLPPRTNGEGSRTISRPSRMYSNGNATSHGDRHRTVK